VSRKLCKARGLPEAGKLKRLKYEQNMGHASNGKGHKKPEMHNMYDPRKSKSGEQGQLGHIAAMMLMTLMYSARVARYDILQAINYLAKRITRWDAKNDRRLHRLMCYVHATADYNMMGFMGDDPRYLTLHCFCDADFAGCPYTLRSTSGCHFDLQGPNSRMALGAGSNMQTSTAQSTPEAELASLQEGMKKRGESAFVLWNRILTT